MWLGDKGRNGEAQQAGYLTWQSKACIIQPFFNECGSFLSAGWSHLTLRSVYVGKIIPDVYENKAWMNKIDWGLIYVGRFFINHVRYIIEIWPVLCVEREKQNLIHIKKAETCFGWSRWVWTKYSFFHGGNHKAIWGRNIDIEGHLTQTFSDLLASLLVGILTPLQRQRWFSSWENKAGLVAEKRYQWGWGS